MIQFSRSMHGVRVLSTLLYFFLIHVELRAQAVTDGLVEYWSFDNDFVGLNGTPINAQAYENLDPGHNNTGQSVSLNENSALFLGGGSPIRNLAGNPEGLTFSGWIEDERFNVGGVGYFYSAYNFSLSTVTGSTPSDRKIQLEIFYNDPEIGLYSATYATLPGSLITGWHHVVVTMYPDQSVRIFLDGEETPVQVIAPYQGGPYQGDHFTLINNRYGGTGHFLGKIDEYMFFDKVLSRNQIKTLYDANWVDDGEDWPGLAGGSAPLIKNGLVEYFSFESTVIGYKGSIPAEETNLTYESGKTGNGRALHLDEISTLRYDDYAPINEIAGNSEGFSFSAWINDSRFGGLGGAGSLYSAQNFNINTKGNDSERYIEVYIRYTNDPLLVQSEPGALAAGWQHVVITVDTYKNVKIFIDGNEVNLQIISPYPGGEYAGDGVRFINREYGGNNHFLGEIDEYMFFNRPLEESEIKLLHDPNSIGQLWEVAGVNENGGIDIYYQYGNVGVLTPDTRGYEFAVAGKILAEEVKVQHQDNWPDFVFEETYDLQSLKEIESYIQTHHHLPNIPSEAEVKSDGIVLGEMDGKLLQKIEELTLHMIEMNKRLEVLEKENETLIKDNAELKAEVKLLKKQ